MTSLTTLLATVSLLLFAGDKIRGFSLVLTVGIIVGTYSSIFIASPIVNIWEFLFSRKKKIKKEKKDKKIISTEKSVSENKDDGVESQKTSSTTGGSGSAISKKMLKKLSGKKK